MREALRVAIAALFVIGVGIVYYELGASRAPAEFERALSTPCATEDSTNCHWSAATMGNGDGRSFVNVAGNVYYLSE